MPYVTRDESGKVNAVSLNESDEFREFLDAESAELEVFFENARPSADSLRESDSDLVRVLEDLIEMLTAKGVIMFRKRLRKDRTNALDLLGDE
jgi:hypothetical protein